MTISQAVFLSLLYQAPQETVVSCLKKFRSRDLCVISASGHNA
jgi:hypothetical protein